MKIDKRKRKIFQIITWNANSYAGNHWNTAWKMNFYPFGISYQSSFYRDSCYPKYQPFKFGGKELDMMNGLNLYDFVARGYDPVVGRFLTPDPLAEKYPWISQYAYCMNNPVNAVDRDGRLVVFINGMHNGGGGKSKYWARGENYLIGFDHMVMNHLNDYNAIYRDGSVGGWDNVGNNKNADYRIEQGERRGKLDAAQILTSIKDSDGNIKETIKIITHSMGAAYAKGYIKGLIDAGVPISLIEFEADFAPFQPTKQKAVDGVKTYQFSNDHDNVANNRLLGSPYGPMPGAEVTTDSDPNKGHPIVDFMNQINNLPEGRYKYENGKFVPY
jgi:RHS repeat-associated protein